MFTRYLSGLGVLCLLVGNSLAGEPPSEPGERIAPKIIELSNGDAKAAKQKALKQRKMELWQAPDRAPLVAEIQLDGSIVIHHRPAPEVNASNGRKPQ